MNCNLDALILHLAEYRKSVDAMLGRGFSKPKELQLASLDILVRVSRLYLDYCLFQSDIRRLWLLSSETATGDIPRPDGQREQLLRVKVMELLESCTHWSQFDPSRVACLFPHLRTLQDYMNSFALHLPEIYGETIHLDACVRSFMGNHNKTALADMVVGMQHMGRNHITFVVPALESAADDDHWVV